MLYVIQLGDPVDVIGRDSNDEVASSDLDEGESLAGT
jgi:hypothetical protein